MKLSNLLIAALVLVMASCSTTDSSNTTQENTNETADQVTNDSTLVDGNYSIAKMKYRII